MLASVVVSALALHLPSGPSMRPTRQPTASFDPLGLHAAADATQPAFAPPRDVTALAVSLAALAATQPEAAFAKGGAYGIFEGRIISLAHPVVMGTMYAASLWAGFTGLQWRRLREIGTQISGLKSELKPLSEKLESLRAAESPVGTLKSEVSALQAQIDELSQTRKGLAGDNLREKHYQVGSVILGLGTAFAIEGPVNTFLRAQKLFPGPHLYAGAGVVVCWAMAASLAPLMQKGNDSARSAHIAFNVLALGFFTWQLPTGWEITQKVVQFTKFP